MFGAEFKSGAMGVIQASRNVTCRLDHGRVEIEVENGAVICDRHTEVRIHLKLRK